MGDWRLRGGVAEVLERVELWPLTGRLEAGSVLEAIAGETHDGITSLDVEGETLRIPAIGVAPGTPVRLRVAAREVAVACERPERLSIRNVLPARVLRIEFTEAPFAELLLDVHGQHLRSRVTREAVEDLGLHEGPARLCPDQERRLRGPSVELIRTLFQTDLRTMTEARDPCHGLC